MKISFKIQGVITLALIVCMSINTYAQKYYLPDEGELLMIADQGDLKFSTLFPGEGLYATQIGYSPIKHLSVSGSFLYDKTSTQDFGITGSFDQISEGFNANIALGTYYFLGAKKPMASRFFLSKNVTMKQGFLFDLHAGYSYGKINNYYERSAESHFDTNKLYLQGGIHWVFRIGTISYAFRAIRLDYSNGWANGALEEQELDDLFDGGIQSNDPFSFYESSFRYQIGIRQVRIYTGVTTKHQKDNIRPNSDKRIIITAGMIFELDEIFNKKENIEPVSEESN